MGHLYYWIFVLLNIYLLLNMLLAIVMDAYAMVKEEDSNDSPISRDLVAIYHLLRRRLRCKGPNSYEAMAELVEGVTAADPALHYYGGEDLAELFGIGLAEATLLFEDTDMDVDEDREEEAQRTPKMRDLHDLRDHLEEALRGGHARGAAPAGSLAVGQSWEELVQKLDELRRELWSRERGAGGPSVADELVKLADLRDRGVLSGDEFEEAKRKVLAS